MTKVEVFLRRGNKNEADAVDDDVHQGYHKSPTVFFEKNRRAENDFYSALMEIETLSL